MSTNNFYKDIAFNAYVPQDFEQDWSKISECFLFYINELSSHICAETITKITFAIPETYIEAVENIAGKQKKVSDGGLAITLTNKSDNAIHHHIIFNLTPYFFKNLKYTDNTIINFPNINILAHEMAHVDLINNLHAMDNDIYFPMELQIIEKRRFLIDVKKAFEEFFACKLSCSLYPADELSDEHKNHVFEYLKKIKENQIELISNYQANNNYVDYFENSYESLLKLFIYSGYYLGLKKENSQILESNFINLRKLENIFNKLYEYFYNIGDYRDTIDLNIFDDLINYFEELLEVRCFIEIDRSNNRINTPKLKVYF